MAHIFFSIVIVSLNPGKKLAKTVKSVLRQEYGNFEIIIKDGGSTDGSLPEDVPAEGACLAADSRVRIFRGPDRGIYDGMNQALPEINGDYVLFLNCGDSLYDPLVLARTAELIEEAEAGRDSRLRARPFLFYGDQYNEKQQSRVCSAPKLTDLPATATFPVIRSAFTTPLFSGKEDTTRISA